MHYVRLGCSGLKVSRIALGCMSFGTTVTDWGLDEQQSRAVFKRALDMGINFFDTANMYGLGQSETVLGAAVRELGRRDDLVIATKVFFPMSDDTNDQGLSRKAIMRAVDASLKRLQTDYIDLYQIHRFDYSTPIEETLEALDDLVKSGKVRYLGASSMFAWQFCSTLHIAERNGWTRFAAMQPFYNLLNREEEREMLPLCLAEGIGVIPWSPLARGRLARRPEEWNSTSRARTDKTAPSLFDHCEEADGAVAERVAEVAERHRATMAEVALAWLLTKPAVTSPIIGATRLEHLDPVTGALNLKLSPEDIEDLEHSYIPHPIVGYQ